MGRSAQIWTGRLGDECFSASSSVGKRDLASAAHGSAPAARSGASRRRASPKPRVCCADPTPPPNAGRWPHGTRSGSPDGATETGAPRYRTARQIPAATTEAADQDMSPVGPCFQVRSRRQSARPRRESHSVMRFVGSVQRYAAKTAPNIEMSIAGDPPPALPGEGRCRATRPSVSSTNRTLHRARVVQLQYWRRPFQSNHLPTVAKP